MSFVVFDIETTGLSSFHNEIIQFAYIMFDSNNQFVKAENLYFYREGMHWDQDLSDRVHHITLDFLKQFEDQFEENLLKMYSVLNRANVSGYNSNSFDCPFVKNWLSKFGLNDFEFGIKQDAMIGLRPRSKRARIKLVKMLELFDLTDEMVAGVSSLWFDSSKRHSAHDAVYDTTATALLTLEGLRQGYMTFDFNVNTDGVVDDSSFDFISEEHTLPMYPNTFALCVAGRWIAFNPDHTKYRDVQVDEGNFGDMWVLNHKLSSINDDEYAVEVRGCTIKWYADDNKETLVIITPWVSMNSNDTELLPLLKSLCKEE